MPLGFKSSVLAIAASTAVLAVAAPTTIYDPDANVMPNATGQMFAGGTSAGTNRMSLTSLGKDSSGKDDYVLTVNTQGSDNYAYVFKGSDQTPTTWNVSRSLGYSVEISIRLDSVQATESGSAVLLFGSADRAPSLRFIRAAGAPTMTVELRMSGSNTPLATSVIDTPDRFHTFRADVLNDDIDVYIDGVLTHDNLKDTGQTTTVNRIQFGDATPTADGVYQIQYIKTWQTGVVPEPGALGLLGTAAIALAGRRRPRPRRRRDR